MRVVIVGHVDHGKSTLIGRLLYDTDSIPDDKMEAVNQVCEKLGHETEFAFLLDQFQEERMQSMTIDTTQVLCKTAKRIYTIIDAPGHKEFLNNMITGASQAEIALLVVDAQNGVREQTKRHAYILTLLGIDKIIVVINKMDLVDYNEKIFREVTVQLFQYLSTIEITPVHVIPISAKQGENVVRLSQNMKWYRGLSVVAALDSVPDFDRLSDRPLRFPVQDVYDIKGKQIIVGRVESGKLKKGQTVVLSPSGKESKIKSIEVFNREIDSAETGNSIGLTLDNGSFAERGTIINDVRSQPIPTKIFNANIICLSAASLSVGQPLFVRCATQKQKCRIVKIDRRINSSSLELIEKHSDQISNTEVASVVFETDCPIVVEKFSYIKELGRIVLTCDNGICAAGIVV